jgi:hypothetical protein
MMVDDAEESQLKGPIEVLAPYSQLKGPIDLLVPYTWYRRRCGPGSWISRRTTSLPFLLEYDNGTERLERLAGTGHVRGVDVRGFAPLTDHDDLGVLVRLGHRRHETRRPRSRHKPR